MTPSPSSRQRQRLAAACDECRRRKLRCDGQQPQCHACRQSGVLCQVSQRGVRGPKKGYIKALKDRLVNLEAQLSDRLSTQQHQLQAADTGGGFDITLPTPPTRVSNEHRANASQEILSFAPGADAALSPSTFLDPPGWTPTLCSTPNTDLYISDIMHAELDQLYLDRVHPSIPILHQRRYLSWSKLHSKTPTRTCLQHVMWTLATLLSAQFRDMTEPLYQKAKQMLESLSIESNGRRSCDTELVQAWVLLATCESMRTYHQAAWMSAGRAFRLIQAMRFHEVDTPGRKNDPSLSNNDDFIETEEKRRVFWMAYLLDHLLGIRSDWPITLNEHVVCTRLPAPDSKFQSSQHVLGSFLSEAMTESSSGAYSPFNECLIFVTLCGRSLLRDQQNKISKAYGDTGLDQQQWLDGLLKIRLQTLSQRYPSFTEANDPLLLFANILGQFSVVYYCKGIIEAVTRLPDSMEASTQVVETQNRALQAAGVIIQLARAMQDLHFSKVHPLMPIPLFSVAEFLFDYCTNQESFRSYLEELVNIFYELKNVNNHQQSYVDLLPQSCISKTAEMLHHGVKARAIQSDTTRGAN